MRPEKLHISVGDPYWLYEIEESAFVVSHLFSSLSSLNVLVSTKHLYRYNLDFTCLHSDKHEY